MTIEKKFVDQSKKVAAGQAINLAVHDALHNKKENDPGYIYKKFMYYHKLAAILQGSDMDLIQEVINNKKFDKVMADLEEALK